MKKSYIVIISISSLFLIVLSIKYDYLNDLTNIGVFITSILTLLTLGEVKQQRESSYRPDIHLKKILIDFEFIENTNYSNAKLSETKLELYNIGFGAAKNIEVIWDSNIPQILIDKIDQINEGKYVYELSENVLLLNGAGYHDRPSMYQKFEFLLPENNTADSQFINIPDSILQLYIIMAILYKENPVNIHCPLDISYYDVGNKRYKKKYTLNLGLYYYDTKFKKGILELGVGL